MKQAIKYLPLLFFLILTITLFQFLDKKDDGQLPSALLDKQFPSFYLPKLESEELVSQKDFIKSPYLLNVWATWCIACRVEHPFLMFLKEKSEIAIYGLNYKEIGKLEKDGKEVAMELLKEIGSPYEFSGFDEEGKLAMDLGVYGAPETFLVDKEGVIRIRHVGVLSPEVWKEKFEKVLRELND